MIDLKKHTLREELLGDVARMKRVCAEHAAVLIACAAIDLVFLLLLEPDMGMVGAYSYEGLTETSAWGLTSLYLIGRILALLAPVTAACISPETHQTIEKLLNQSRRLVIDPDKGRTLCRECREEIRKLKRLTRAAVILMILGYLIMFIARSYITL